MAEQDKIILMSIDSEEFRQIIRDTVSEVLAEHQRNRNRKLAVSRNEARKLLGIGYKKLNRLILDGHIRITEDGRIPYSSIEEYLKKEIEI